MLKATPSQLVFGRNLILNIKHVADWDAIRHWKQEKITVNNKKENQSQLPHKYRVGDLVLFKNRTAQKLEMPYKGPYWVMTVFRNGMVQIQVGPVEDQVNIKNIQPFK